VVLTNKNSFSVLTVCRTGGTDLHDKMVMENIITCLNDLCSVTNQCLLVGDLNCGGIDWEKFCVNGDSLQKLFFDSVCNQGFHQLVNKPTREEAILDLVLCNDPLFVASVAVVNPFSTSDHSMVIFVLDINLSEINSTNYTSGCIGTDDKISLWKALN